MDGDLILVEIFWIWVKGCCFQSDLVLSCLPPSLRPSYGLPCRLLRFLPCASSTSFSTWRTTRIKNVSVDLACFCADTGIPPRLFILINALLCACSRVRGDGRIPYVNRLQELGLVIPSLPEASLLSAGAGVGGLGLVDPQQQQQHAASLASMAPASEEAKQRLKALKAAQGERRREERRGGEIGKNTQFV